jgi:hypothetical protein
MGRHDDPLIAQLGIAAAVNGSHVPSLTPAWFDSRDLLIEAAREEWLELEAAELVDEKRSRFSPPFSASPLHFR